MSIDTEPRVRNAPPTPAKKGSPPTKPGATPTTAPPPRMPGRRNPRWIALGIVALCLGGLLSYVLYARVASETSVVAMTTTVHRGETVRLTDLTSVTIGGSAKIRTVPAQDLDQLVGRKAVFDLVEGSLVPAGGIADITVPDVGRAVVGLKLAQGRAPIGLLVASAPVRLVTLPAASDQGDNGTPLAGKTFFARVIDQSEGADGTSILLNVDVSADDAPAVTLLAAQDRIAVLRDADK
jgi:hypothetical protein